MVPLPFTYRGRLRDGARVIDVNYDARRFVLRFGMEVITTEQGSEMVAEVGDITLVGDYVRAYYTHRIDGNALVLFISQDGTRAVIGQWHIVQGLENGMADQAALPSSPDQLTGSYTIQVLSHNLQKAG